MANFHAPCQSRAVFGPVLLTILLCVWAAQTQAQTVTAFLTPPWYSDGAGLYRADIDRRIQFRFAVTPSTLAPGQTLQPPFTIRSQLPEGMHNIRTNASAANWSCNVVDLLLTCTYSAALTAMNWQSTQLRIDVDVASALPIPGSSQLRFTLESADLPPPDTATCPSTPQSDYFRSTSGCVQVTLTHKQPYLRLINFGLWPNPHIPWEAGTTRDIRMQFQSVGYGLPHGQVTTQFLLPPGFEYVSSSNQSVPWSCTAGTLEASGQWVSCTTPQLAEGIGAGLTNLQLRLRANASVPAPGPHRLHAVVWNGHQVPPEDITDCAAASPPEGCGYIDITTTPAQLPLLDIVGFAHSPTKFRFGTGGSVQIQYSNIGQAAVSGPISLSVSAPPGFSYQSVQSPNHTASCSIGSGTVISGQILDCTLSGGMAVTPPTSPHGASVSLNFALPDGAAPIAVLLAGIGSTERPGPTLEQCALDPDATGCGEYEIPVSQGLFCDGFESEPMFCD